MTAVAFADISLAYEGSGQLVRALEGLHLEVAKGEPISVIGPSGCGKSTMLLLAAGLLIPDAGTLTVDGKPVDGPRQETALILQDHGLLPWKTVAENAALGLKVRRRARPEISRRTADALDAVGLAEFSSAYPGELSGGMRQRVALARALALDADLLLMDEPLSALDALTREDLQDVLLELWRRRGHTAVLVTHSIEEAVYLGRRVVVLSPRPAKVSAIVDNPRMGDHGYRSSTEFYERCVHLRELLAEEGAVGAGAQIASGAL